MDKVYLVIAEWAFDGEKYGSDASVHVTYEGAKQQFERVKKTMQNDYAIRFDCDDTPIFDEDENIVEINDRDHYEIYPLGRWSENHNSVRIEEKILLK